MGIIIERKLPERGDRGLAAAPAGQCCCCCCCCLHTVGSVAGALSARPVPLDPAAIPISAVSAVDPPTLVPKYSATGLYWAICAILSGISIGYFVGLEHDHVRTMEVAVLLAMVFPGVQLAASLIALIAIAASKRVGREIRLRHLGKITLRAFLGAVVGTLIMVPLFGKC